MNFRSSVKRLSEVIIVLCNRNLNLVSGVSIALITASFLAACGQQQTETKVQGVTPQVVTGNAAPSDRLGPRYQATLSEGITFNRDGYPNFVSSVKGISGKEAGGRWTDGTQTVIEFTQALPRSFMLKIKAEPFPPTVSMGKPIKILVGATQLEIRFSKPGVADFAIPVATDGNARSITFEFPDAKSPHALGLGSDTRRISVALISLRIE